MNERLSERARAQVCICGCTRARHREPRGFGPCSKCEQCKEFFFNGQYRKEQP